MLTFHFSDNIIIDKADKTIDTTHSLSRMPSADRVIQITLNVAKWPNYFYHHFKYMHFCFKSVPSTQQIKCLRLWLWMKWLTFPTVDSKDLIRNYSIVMWTKIIPESFLFSSAGGSVNLRNRLRCWLQEETGGHLCASPPPVGDMNRPKTEEDEKMAVMLIFARGSQSPPLSHCGGDWAPREHDHDYFYSKGDVYVDIERKKKEKCFQQYFSHLLLNTLVLFCIISQ